MTDEQLREEVRRLIAQDEPERAQDDSYLDERLPSEHDGMIANADNERDGYERAAKGAVEEHKRREYEEKGRESARRGDELRRLRDERKVRS